MNQEEEYAICCNDKCSPRGGRQSLAETEKNVASSTCEDMHVLIGTDRAGEQELKTRNCRLAQTEHRRTSESGMNQRGVGCVDKAAGDRATEDLDQT